MDHTKNLRSEGARVFEDLTHAKLTINFGLRYFSPIPDLTSNLEYVSKENSFFRSRIRRRMDKEIVKPLLFN